MSDVVEDVDTREKTSNGNGDHDVFAHYVNKVEMTKALIEGTPVIALCGKVWVPHRDPEKYPVCPTCKELYSLLFNAPAD